MSQNQVFVPLVLMGLPRGIVAYDLADVQTGDQKAVFDLAWPNGVQEELSQPVAVLLNEEPATVTLASQAGDLLPKAATREG